MRNRASQETANAISGLVLTAANRSDPIFRWYRLISEGVAKPFLGSSSLFTIGVLCLMD
jgi:hypothetical protein